MISMTQNDKQQNDNCINKEVRADEMRIAEHLILDGYTDEKLCVILNHLSLREIRQTRNSVCPENVPPEQKSRRARINDAVALIINTSDKELSDDEYNMLLIFAFLYGHSAGAREWLGPILGLSRFQPSNRCRPADPKYDIIRVYENVTGIIEALASAKGYRDVISEDAAYVVSLMRTKSPKDGKTNRKVVKSISIKTLDAAPGQAYINAVQQLADFSSLNS